MRRFRRSARRGSSGKKRKLYWGASQFVGQNQALTVLDVASFWIKWPSGLFDPQRTSPEGNSTLTASDETWSRLVISSSVQVPVQGVLPESLPSVPTIGLIAWDAASQADAESLELAITSIADPGSAPSPTLRGDLDWIIRIPFPVLSDNSVAFAADATFLNSRAMRKLPPSTGVLACVSYVQPLDVEATTVFSWTIDCRYLLKAGAYEL